MLFWHVGATVAFVRYAFRDEAMDLRFLAVGAILPDLIDTPIGLWMWGSWQTTRLWSHSLLFGSVLMVAVLVMTSRGQRRKQWMLVAIGVLVHLTLDAMWADPETLWWPFLGWSFASTGFVAFSDYAASVLADQRMWAGETIGLVYLAILARSSGLGEKPNRMTLLSTGRVSAPIERS